MNVTRDVMNDLLPVYFSGEASEDTRTLMEEYFRENPEFERMARGAAKPLDALRGVTAAAPEAEKEKRDLECVRGALRRNKMFFGLALFFTLAPLAFVYSHGHITWMMVRNAPWDAAIYWSLSVVLWFLYFARVSRRGLSLAVAIFFTLFPLPFVWHFLAGGAPIPAKGGFDSLWEAALFWTVAAVAWLNYGARLRRRTAALAFAIVLTVLPFPYVLDRVIARPHVAAHWGEPAFVWTLAVYAWLHYWWVRRKGNMDSEC